MINEAQFAVPMRDMPGRMWLEKRRDGRSSCWQVAWYDPARRTVLYRSTKTTDRERANLFLEKFELPEQFTAGAHVPPRPALFVYFIGGDVGAIKVGKALHVKKRLASLQCGSPIPLNIMAVTTGGGAVEHAYHKRFAAHRLHGEWFSRHPDILAEIAILATQETP